MVQSESTITNFSEDPMTLFTISSSGPVNGNGNEHNGATLKSN